MSKVTGLVYSMRSYIGEVSPPATVLEDESRYGSDGDFKAAGHPAWVRLPSGLWTLDFDPTAPDYIQIPADQTQLNFTSEDFSLVARVKVGSLTDARGLFYRGLTTVDGWYIYIHSDGRVLVRTNQAAASQVSRSSDGSIVAGVWYTVGLSRAGTSVRIYINGVDDTDIAGTHIDPLTCARTAKIGIHDDLTTYPFDGKIPFLQIYNYALSAAQHAAIHQAERHWFGV